MRNKISVLDKVTGRWKHWISCEVYLSFQIHCFVKSLKENLNNIFTALSLSVSLSLSLSLCLSVSLCLSLSLSLSLSFSLSLSLSLSAKVFSQKALHKSYFAERGKCPNSELFVVCFSCIQTEYEKMRNKKITEYGRISHNVKQKINCQCWLE